MKKLLFVSLALILFATDATATQFLVADQTKLGNIFLKGEEISIKISGAGESIHWRVLDFWDNVVSEGEETNRPSGITIYPDTKGKMGYFTLKLTGEDEGDQVVSEKTTAFAVVHDNSHVTKENTPFGAMTHFSQSWDTDIIPLITKAGIKTIRDENYWSTVEKNKGEFDFSKFEPFMQKAQENDLDVLLEMTFGNTLYDNHEGSSNTAPYTDEGRAAYANYGKEMLNNYPYTRAMEVWNEYNGSWCVGPASGDRPSFYTQMLKKAYEVLKAEKPDLTIIGGAAVMIPARYYESMFENGALDYMDALCIHPYDNYGILYPEVLEWELSRLNQRILHYNNNTPIPLWATEFGSDIPDRKEIGRYLPRIASIMLSGGVEKMYWYVMRDTPSFPTMGLLRADNSSYGRYAPNPAYAAYSTFINVMYGAEYISSESEGAYVYKFKKDGREIRTCFSPYRKNRLLLKTNEIIKVVDIMGNETLHKPIDNVVSVEIDQDIKYVIGKVDDLSLANAVPITDSLRDFAETQGTNNWYYGTYISNEFTEFDFTPGTWNWTWKGSTQYLEVNQAGGVIPVGSNSYSVKRWVSDIDGEIDVSGLVGRNDVADYHTTEIRIDNQIKHTIDSNGTPHTYQTPRFKVEKGTIVDFATKNTPGGSNSRGDYVLTINILNSDRIDTEFKYQGNSTTAILTNFDSEPQDFVFAAARYNSGKLKEIKLTSDTLNNGMMPISKTLEFHTDEEEGDYTKVFLWNDLSQMIPLLNGLPKISCSVG